MHKIIGNNIAIFLKEAENGLIGDITGILVDVSEENIYIQDSMNGSKVFIVPRENILYCTTDKITSQKRIIDEQDNIQQYQEKSYPTQQQYQAPIDEINVYVNKQHIVSIPIPPTFRVDVWNDNILRVLMGNSEVQGALAGKVQKGLEYYPGEVYIEVDGVTPPSQMPDYSPGYQSSFSMGGSPAEQYLSPMQMAARLNKVVKKGNDDGKPKV